MEPISPREWKTNGLLSFAWVLCVIGTVVIPGYSMPNAREDYWSKGLGTYDCYTQSWLPGSVILIDIVGMALGVAAIVIAVVLFRRTPRVWAKAIAVLAAIVAAAAFTLVAWVFFSQDLPGYMHGFYPIAGCNRDTPVTPEPSPGT